MSGGHFQYKQWEIGNIGDEVEQLILDNDSEEVGQYGDRRGCHFSPETIAEFEKGLAILRQAHVYAQRIDWLVSGDDGEDSFHRRLTAELEKLNA
jgi:hypothetical protein